MRVVGLIGGMSWESSLEYYRLINEGVKNRLGGLHSAKTLMYSVDFEEIERYQSTNDWETAAQVLVDAGKRLERGGADCIVICTNTMHKVADDIAVAVHIPLIHIADATAEKIKQRNLKNIGLLGTNFTMEEDFYKGRLQKKHGINILIPSKEDRTKVHEIIYDELCLGIIKESSRHTYKNIMNSLEETGIDGIILGCTEISLLVHPEDSKTPQFDTTAIHAEAAVDFALGK